MIEIIVPARGGRFANTYAGLYSKLVDVVAQLENLPIRGEFRPAFFRSQAEKLVDAIIGNFERNAANHADPAITSILEAMRENYQAWQDERLVSSQARAKIVDDMAERHKVSQEPTHHALRFIDTISGREVEIALPVAQVRFVDGAAT